MDQIVMHEIKFRAWNNSTNHWLDMFFFFDFIDGKLEYTNKDDVVIEQYTGLKDKNGVEIYEGDIISASVYGFTETGIVEYSEFCEWVFGNIRLNEFMSSLTVIGNIHKNADLLEEE